MDEKDFEFQTNERLRKELERLNPITWREKELVIRTFFVGMDYGMECAKKVYRPDAPDTSTVTL